MDSNRTIFEDGAIHVVADKIADIGKTKDLKEKYPNEEETDLTGRIIVPGLISTHMHTAQTLLRGTADDLELVSWLCERIWVLQGNFTAEDGYAAARLSIGEMLKSGTTCFLESMVIITPLEIPVVRLISRSSLIGMGLMGLLGLLRRVGFGDVWARLLWIFLGMLRMMLGLCILVLLRTVRCRFWGRSICGRSGMGLPMIGFVSGLGLGRLAGMMNPMLCDSLCASC
jgi:cytosine/adenosine deaminase-related metal-dependent hydrolase